jgi:hypothetical protein
MTQFTKFVSLKRGGSKDFRGILPINLTISFETENQHGTSSLMKNTPLQLVFV